MREGPLMVRLCVMAVAMLSGPLIEPHRGGAPPGPLGSTHIAVTFEAQEGWHYDGRIELPAKERRRSWAVLMLGGGLGTDIDWSLPGILSLDGKPTHDGATIAQALLDEEFVVMRWRAIRRGDPRYAEDPLMMDAPKLPQTIDHARRALAAFRERKVVPNDHIFLLGHSLGGHRAGILLQENPNLPGLAMMAGARLLPADVDAARAIVHKSAELFAKSDANEDGFLRTDEFEREQKGALAVAIGSAPFIRIDLDDNGKIDLHELTIQALDLQSDKWKQKDSGPRDRYGHKWMVDVITENRTPTLMLVGTLDERWLVELYLMAVRQRRARHPDFEFEIYQGIGHQLAREVAGDVTHEKYGVIAAGRAGPIDAKVVRRMVEWFKARAR